MHAVDLLIQQHRDIDKFFAKLMAEGPLAQQAEEKVLSLLIKTLKTHMDIEEEIFYPAMEKKLGREEFEHALEEHNVTKPLLEKLEAESTEVEAFAAKLEVLKELVEHHVKEEERDLFPRCRKNFEVQELEKLGDKMEKRMSNDAPELFEEESAHLLT